MNIAQHYSMVFPAHLHVNSYLEYCGYKVLLYEVFDLLGVAGNPDLQPIALSVRGLELLYGAETAEGTIDHDTHPGTERLTLCHTVGGQDNTLPPGYNSSYNRP